MGSKTTNKQATSAFGTMTQAAVNNMNSNLGNSSADSEEAARKRKEMEDAAAQAATAQQAQQASGQEPSAYDTIKSMAGAAASGLGDKGFYKDVWGEISGAGKKKK